MQSNHKPSEVIFGKPLVTTSKRLQRMLLRLQRYSLDVTYTRGSEMYIADTLSRAYIPGEPSVHAVALAKMAMTDGLSVSPRRLEELRASTASDCALQELMQVAVKRWRRDFEHITSCPRYPQSKGQVERAIGAVKNLVKKAATSSWRC